LIKRHLSESKLNRYKVILPLINFRMQVLPQITEGKGPQTRITLLDVG